MTPTTAASRRWAHATACARSQVIARHSLPAMARGYLAVYDSLLGQVPCPAARE